MGTNYQKDSLQGIPTSTDINDNLTKIQEALKESLSRVSTGNNLMQTELDMNNNHIYNLPEPTEPDEPVRKRDNEEWVDEVQGYLSLVEADADRAENNANLAVASADAAQQSENAAEAAAAGAQQSEVQADLSAADAQQSEEEARESALNAIDAAEASGPYAIYATRAAANAALASEDIPDGQWIRVLSDETAGGTTWVYRNNSGTFVDGQEQNVAKLITYENGLTAQQAFPAIPVDNVKALCDAWYLRIDGLQLKMRAFFSNNDDGGGDVYYDADRPRSTANGVTIIDPTSIGTLSDTSLGTIYDQQGTGVGTGCFVRLDASILAPSGRAHRLTPVMAGAMADGITDDAVPIQQCAKVLRLLRNTDGSLIAATSSLLDLESRKYKISSEIMLDGVNTESWVNIRGTNALVIGGGKGTNNCFVYEKTRRIEIYGVEFQSFNKAIKFDTNNVAGAIVNIDRCGSHNNSVFIDSTSFTKSRSTVLNVSRCWSDARTDTAIISHCDVLNVTGSSFQHANSGNSIFYVDSRAVFDGCLFVPYPGARVANSRWADLHMSDETRSITFRDCRISGEGGGITAVYVMGQGAGGSRTLNYVTFRGGYVSAGSGGPDNLGGAVILADNGASSFTPNFIGFYGANVVSSWLVKTESGLPVSNPSPVGFRISYDEFIKYTTEAAGLSFLVEDQLKPFVDLSSRAGTHQITSPPSGGSLDTSIAGQIILTLTSATTITDLANGIQGHRIYITNRSISNNITLQDISNGSNMHLGGADLQLAADQTVMLYYLDSTENWWLA